MLNETRGRFTVLYATQTGNAADVADRLGRRAQRQRFGVKIFDLNDYPIQNLIQENLVIFVCSTTGQGECPDGMIKFWKFLLRKQLPSDSLASLSFCVVGLGDSSYEKFNVVAKRLCKRLPQLGARELLPVAFGDDQHELGYDAAVDPWMIKFFDRISTIYPPVAGLNPLKDDAILPAKYRANFVPENANKSAKQISQFFDPRYKQTYVKLKENVRVTSPDHFQAVHRIVFDLRGTDIKYKPGDVAVLWPKNHPDKVNAFLSLLNIPTDQPFVLQTNDPEVSLPLGLPEFLTIRECATSYWDIQSIPRRKLENCIASELESQLHLLIFVRACYLIHHLGQQSSKYMEMFRVFVKNISSIIFVSEILVICYTMRKHLIALTAQNLKLFGFLIFRSFFDLLLHFSQSELEQEKLQEFTSAEGQEELYSYCNRPRRTIVEVLQDFPNTTPHIPLDYLFDLIPCIRPRSFSIASSLEYHHNELQLLVAVVNYQTRLHEPRRGLCSTWLSVQDASQNVLIPLSVKGGSISLPSDSYPLIMVGPGTGCAPFRGFIQERVSRGIKENYFFFGCRNRTEDFFCSEEWQSFVDRGLLNLFVAFSRDQEEKIYVQHKMLEQSALLWDLISARGAYVYIAGNAKQMPQDVKNALLTVISEQGNMDSESSKKFLISLEAQKRLQIEAWS